MVNRWYCLIINARPWYHWGYKSLGLKISRPAPKLMRTCNGRTNISLIFRYQIILIYIVTMLWLLRKRNRAQYFLRKTQSLNKCWISEYSRLYCIVIMQFFNIFQYVQIFLRIAFMNVPRIYIMNLFCLRIKCKCKF